MIYTMDERQLLRMWSVISCFAHIRETRNTIDQDEILTKAQILLTAFVLDIATAAGRASQRTGRTRCQPYGEV
jgi:hypothetical protein